MRFAYADPPYLGCGKLYAKHHPEALVWDDPEEHRHLIERLSDEWPDGWAMSASTPSLRTLLPMCPPDVRVLAWTKPFCIFKPNVGLAYAWEPVIMRGGRRITREQLTVRDYCAVNITLKKGLTGAKPPGFCDWLLSALNVQMGDTLDDLFPGTGAVSAAYEARVGCVTPPPSLAAE
jgi:hypothetical protein